MLSIIFELKIIIDVNILWVGFVILKHDFMPTVLFKKLLNIEPEK